MKQRRKKILVIEDDPGISRGLVQLAESEGFRVHHTPDGEKGLALLALRKPDIVLLDVSLPGLGGLEVCRRARAKGYGGAILMVSARTEPVDRVAGLEAGADDYVTKPFHPQELVARIRARLRMAGRAAGGAKGGSAKRRTRRDGPRRRLRAVLFSDMKDFSRRMNEDESRALLLLRRHNRVVRATVERYGGSVVEVIGDAFLACFASALKAVDAALALQRRLARLNAGKPVPERIRVRIGIHIGDIIEEAGKKRGDVVNIAARLQQMGTPDTVTVSQAVYAAVEGRLLMRVSRIGARKMKNIRQPVTVYRLSPVPPSSRRNA